MDLSSFRSTVKVGDYPVWLFKSGVKPSKTVGLGCVANVNGTTYGILVGLNSCTVNLSKGLCVPQDQWQQLVSLGLPGNYFDGDTMPKD